MRIAISVFTLFCVCPSFVLSDVCLDQFGVRNQTIINTGESRKNGAEFLHESSKVRNAFECAQQCCQTKNCNAAIYRYVLTHDCYLFDCGPLDDFRCVFDTHDEYVAMGMRIERKEFDSLRFNVQKKHEADLSSLKDSNERDSTWFHGDDRRQRKYGPVTKSPYRNKLQQWGDEQSPRSRSSPFQQQKPMSRRCGPLQWQCPDGECIAEYDRCDRIPQCSDGADENEEDCRRLEAERQTNNRRRPAPGLGPAVNRPTPPPFTAPLVGTPKEEKNTVVSNGSKPVDGAAKISIQEETKSTSIIFQNVRDGTSLAMVTLGLGLCLLALFLVFVSCRLRSARRSRNRIRRPMKGMGTEDEEELMNGLHL